MNENNLNGELIYETILGQNQTKDYLRQVLNLSDRGLRLEIQQLAKKYPVITYSSKKGYEILDVKNLLEGEQKQIEEAIIKITKTLKDYYTRIKALKERVIPLRVAMLKLNAKLSNEEVNDEDIKDV